MLSTDPLFVEIVRGIVGLFLNSPDNAIVQCTDHKRHNQAFDHLQSLLPMGLGASRASLTHTDVTSLQFFGRGCVHRGADHSAQSSPSTPCLSWYSSASEKLPPSDLVLSLIAEDYPTHNHARAGPAERPLTYVYHIPNYACCFNQDECWFGASRSGRYDEAVSPVSKS